MNDEEFEKRFNAWLEDMRASSFGLAIRAEIENKRDDLMGELLTRKPEDIGRMGWLQGYLACLSDQEIVVFGKKVD